MNLSSEAIRFVPLVKSVASKTQQALIPEMQTQVLVDFGLRGLSDGLTQYKSRQGLTQRDFLIYRIRAAIYTGLAGYAWPTDEERQKYVFLKKTNELLMNFHLSAEGTIKRSIKAEEEELLHLMKLLATIALLCRVKNGESPLKEGFRNLEQIEQEFIHFYYDQDLDLQNVAERMRISESAAARFNLKVLDRLILSGS